MQNINDPPNNNDMVMQSSNNSTEENSNRTISSNYLTTRVEQPMALSEEAIDMQLTGIDEGYNRQIEESIRYEFIYLPALYNLTMKSILYCVFHVCWYCYWYCLLSISFDIGFEYGWYLVVLELMLVDIGAFPRTIFDNELTTTTGRFQSWHRNPTYHHRFGSTRGDRASGHIEHPINTGAFVGITVTFSSTVEEYWPPTRESVAVEDTQPHDMPPPMALHITDRAQPANLNNDTINNQANHLPNGVIGRDEASQDIREQFVRTTSGGALEPVQRGSYSRTI